VITDAFSGDVQHPEVFGSAFQTESTISFRCLINVYKFLVHNTLISWSLHIFG